MENVKDAVKKTIGIAQEKWDGLDERTKSTVKGGVVGAVVGSIVEEFGEFIIPGAPELGALGEIAGAVFGVGVANKDKIMQFLEELKKVTNTETIDDLINTKGYQRWKKKYPEQAAVVDRGFTMS